MITISTNLIIIIITIVLTSRTTKCGEIVDLVRFWMSVSTEFSYFSSFSVFSSNHINDLAGPE